MELAQKFGESEEVANGIGCHHKEVEPNTLEATLLEIADTISASRPGVRGGQLERMDKMESIACSFDDVEHAVCLNAGEETHLIAKAKGKTGVMLGKEISEAVKAQTNLSSGLKISVGKKKEYLS